MDDLNLWLEELRRFNESQSSDNRKRRQNLLDNLVVAVVGGLIVLGVAYVLGIG